MKVVNDAITQAVKDYEQSELLAQALIAWFTELANGNESINDTEKVKRRLDILLEKTILRSPQVNGTVSDLNE